MGVSPILKVVVVVLEDGRVTYFGTQGSQETGSLCFSIHQSQLSAKCCELESAHLHAHVHRGEEIEKLLLEPCSVPDFSSKMVEEKTHKHGAECGHQRIAHGDHFDWLVPLTEDSFTLSHVQDSKEFEHGQLLKVGESLARLNGQPNHMVEVFKYEASQTSSRIDESAEEVRMDVNDKQPIARTRLNVLGICCAGEIPAIKMILEPLSGVEDVSVNYTTRTVTILHNPLLTPASQLAKALNEARMEASVLHEGPQKSNPEYKRSLWLLVSGVLLVLSFLYLFYLPLQWFAIGTILLGAPGIALKAVMSLKRLRLDVNVLMLIAIIGAMGLQNYIEAGSIVFLFSFADWLQLRAVKKANEALAFAADLVPQNATLADSGLPVPLKEIQLGTLISVKAGEMVPIDGVLISGESSLNESSLTGESRPVAKHVGDNVWAGTVNLSGYLVIETISTAEDSALSRMIKLVEEAQSKRTHTEQVVETFAKYYTPAVFLVATATALIPLLLYTSYESHWLYLSLIIVVVACPCALVISTPVTATCAIAGAAKLGLIIKGGDCLELLASMKVVAIDKTGTLTEGHFRVLDFHVVNSTETPKSELLQRIAGVESHSIHPVATAFVGYVRILGIKPSENVADFKILEGEGVSAVVDGHLIEIGNTRLAFRRNWRTSIFSQHLEEYEKQGATICWVGVNGELVGHFSAADKARSEAREAIENIKNSGVTVLMLTGDNQNAAACVSHQLGGIEFHAELLPRDKVMIIEQLKASVGTTAMVGDGVNDAPALAAAHIGIAMGVAGSAMAMEIADIALMMNDLRRLAVLRTVGKSYRNVVMQNIFFSLFTKLVVVGLAVAGYTPLWAAVLADVGTCVLVTFNGMQLLFKHQSSRMSKPEEASDGSRNGLKDSDAKQDAKPSVTCKTGCCAASQAGGSEEKQDGKPSVNCKTGCCAASQAGGSEEKQDAKPSVKCKTGCCAASQAGGSEDVPTKQDARSECKTGCCRLIKPKLVADSNVDDSSPVVKTKCQRSCCFRNSDKQGLQVPLLADHV
ncbi:putative inactive cadmium/zinc-transporting ATPase HMA3 isoform X2 [Selaginella moellendorffii]|uniref:putative inactive cadmium/zinc-transporting ATPase HMA3 isoform X2 n=1 Tax=Selaginella moellendorffii TaxID=88036 RepID=UPI000D1D0577|nr:putative inactive cadmium/zinc-transporting ATPase HMA3 isoform X2 [Selaginella moellendorffii]|eukprot:XP_024531832.1 putative inactive cadmium/zinc-transporting ATPase HMA3 isoform X2 [Selaginella moellendorffii]